MQRVDKSGDSRVSGRRPDSAHFCHVRFLWRLDFKRFLRLCLFILRRRFFFRLPMVRELKGKEVPIRPRGVKLQFLPCPASLFRSTAYVCNPLLTSDISNGLNISRFDAPNYRGLTRSTPFMVMAWPGKLQM